MWCLLSRKQRLWVPATSSMSETFDVVLLLFERLWPVINCFRIIFGSRKLETNSDTSSKKRHATPRRYEKLLSLLPSICSSNERVNIPSKLGRKPSYYFDRWIINLLSRSKLYPRTSATVTHYMQLLVFEFIFLLKTGRTAIVACILSNWEYTCCRKQKRIDNFPVS